MSDTHTQIVKQDWVLWPDTFVGSVLEKWAIHLFCLVVKLGYNSVYTQTVRVTGFPC